MFKKFNGIVILFFLLKNYSEGGGSRKRTREEGIGETSGQQIQELKCKWDGCLFLFNNEGDFAKHVKKHAKDSQDWICRWTDCKRNGKPFIQLSDLVKHTVVHTGFKPYVCMHVNDGVHCSKSFSLKGNCDKHHHQFHPGCNEDCCKHILEGQQSNQPHEGQKLPTNVESQRNDNEDLDTTLHL
ncbi:unnamed protein product [Meloidogyne enterolobii]|uniref:Uncharacterized protein n=1 Tax=Meloidogyne enterolobii TaxID=390850 RepID=A0ACB0XWZ6_MELEN